MALLDGSKRGAACAALRYALLAAVSGASGATLSCVARSSPATGDKPNGVSAKDASAPTNEAVTDASDSPETYPVAAGAACGSPQPGHGPGWEMCEGGYVHRDAEKTCHVVPHEIIETDSGATGLGECERDEDCAEADEFCIMEGGPYPEGSCIKACSTDAECGAGSVCACTTASYGMCTPGNCSVDSDCSAGRLCVGMPASGGCSSGPTSYYCQTPLDECARAATPAACDDCHYEEDHFACHPLSGYCGRPFLVAGAQRLADAACGEAWSADVGRQPTADVCSKVKELLTAHFVEQALMEHASIAAFARFGLQLLALGAPATLLTETAQAMVDETRHAVVCFDLARRYSDAAIQPGPLDISGALPPVELIQVTALVVREGCIGESVAALQAAWAAAECTDPVVRAALEGIAADELRHAQLAFQFVAWAGAQDARIARLVAEVLSEARREPTHEVLASDAGFSSEHAVILAQHGMLSPALRRQARDAVVHDILPELLARATGSRLSGQQVAASAGS